MASNSRWNDSMMELLSIILERSVSFVQSQDFMSHQIAPSMMILRTVIAGSHGNGRIGPFD
jgi:hypothetical protein